MGRKLNWKNPPRTHIHEEDTGYTWRANDDPVLQEKEERARKFTQIFHSVDDKFNFGKHKGKTLKEILRTNSHYIAWALREDIILIDLK